METSILIARILGVMYLSFGLGVLLNWANYKKVILDILGDAGFMVLAGMVALAVGIAIISYHDIWGSDWRTLITIVGWIGTIKGVFLLMFPTKMTMYVPLFKIDYFRWILLVATLAMGTLFTYFGFIA